jgi:tricorn protease
LKIVRNTFSNFLNSKHLAINSMNRTTLILIVLFFALIANAQTITPQTYFYEPAISPDRSEIAFVSGGDIWTVSATGGEARLLVSHPANELRPMYSPDNKKLAFISNRTGNGDIYILTLATGDLKRLTFDDSNEQLDGFSRDGNRIYFSSTSKDISGMNDIFSVSVSGGTPMQVAADRYMNEFFAAPSPDGKTIAFTARGFSQWWRKGSSNMDTSEIWTWNAGNYSRITEDGSRNVWAMWSGDGQTLYYVSDRGGSQNIWSKRLNGKETQITKFKDGRVLWANISLDGKIIVFERDFKIWKLDTDSKKATEVSINLRGVNAVPSITRESGTIQEFSLSPDGKKVVFSARGEIFAASASDGGDAFRVTNNVASDSDAAWSPDSRKIVYASNRGGIEHIFSYDFLTNTETQISNGSVSDFLPRFSPDGKMIAFMRGNTEVRVFDVEKKQEKLLATGLFDKPPFNSERPFVWSPDSQRIAFFSTVEKQFNNVHIADVENGQVKQVSFLANTNANTLSWSPDGTFITYVSNQRTETSQVARIDLVPRTPQFLEDDFGELFDKPRTKINQKPTPTPIPTPTPSSDPESLADLYAATAKTTWIKLPNGVMQMQTVTDVKKNDIEFENIRKRLNFLPISVDVNSESISPDGKNLMLLASSGGQTNLFVYPLDEISKKSFVVSQITATPTNKSNAEWTKDSNEIAFLENGRVTFVNIETQRSRNITINSETDVDFSREKMAVFEQAWNILNSNFYDDKFHGADWNVVKKTYEPLIAGAQNTDVLRRLLNLMVGELNASHLGANGASAFQAQLVGKLGLRFDRNVYEQTGKLKITEIIALSPAGINKEIKVGQFLLAVDGKNIEANTNLDELLLGKNTRKVNLTISDDGTAKKDVSVKPVSTGTEKQLLYRQWVEDNREYVDKLSNGKLGYVHIPDMSENSLRQLYNDLDAENYKREAVVIDIRNNNGGFVNVYAIDVFSRKGYLNFTPRGFPTSNGRTNLGQRSLEKPTILITNRNTLSDGEDFTEGYRTLKLGKVVGEPTAGWIIFTSGVTLLDGTNLRLPFIKITTNEGVDMELNSRPVDVPVKRAIGESYQNKDSQLDTAVKELLVQIGGSKK